MTEPTLQVPRCDYCPDCQTDYSMVGIAREGKLAYWKCLICGAEYDPVDDRNHTNTNEIT